MNEDIKELIENLEFAEGAFDYMLTPDDIELLLDYIKKLQNNWDKLKKWLEEEKNRLATQVSNAYEDSLGKRRFVNEDIFNELAKVSGKMQELEQGKDE